MLGAMGYGDYSLEAHRALTEARSAQSATQVFRQNQCHPSMNPKGIRFRESRDSDAHPNSVGIVFALDVSGSMGLIPHSLATKTLPTFMENVLTVMPDPQILFMAFGNAYADRSPIQVGQFESEASLIDQWLARAHLEGGGGGLGESYDLAMYVAARHTAMDCLEKRGKKGYFFMTGDEPTFVHLDKDQVRNLIGDPLEAHIPCHELIVELTKSFHPFFLIPDRDRAARNSVGDIWRNHLHERCIVLEAPEDVAVVAALLIAITEGTVKGEAAIRAHVEGPMKRSGAEADRVVRVVMPYAEAFAKGPIAGPIPMGVNKNPPRTAG